MKLLNLDSLRDLFFDDASFQQFKGSLVDALKTNGVINIQNGQETLCYAVSADIAQQAVIEAVFRREAEGQNEG